MHATPIQNTNQAIHYIQSLPVNLQQELLDWINVFKEKHRDDEMTATEKFFEGWQAWHKENQTFLDNDVSWADTKDKNDIGREVSFA